MKDILDKLRSLRLETMVDTYGELDFSEEEQAVLLELFETRDVSIIRRINPIMLCIICNEVPIL